MPRWFYLALTIILFGVEVLIALFVNDTFVRPYLGDIIVVILLYCFIRIFFPKGIKLLPLYVFLFACCIEFFQYINIVNVFGFSDNPFISTIIGTFFDWKDVICYALGCLITAVFQHFNKSIN